MLKWRYYYNQIKLTLEILYCAHAGLSHSIRPTIEDLLHSNDSRSKEEDPNHPTSKETTAKEGVSNFRNLFLILKENFQMKYLPVCISCVSAQND